MEHEPGRADFPQLYPTLTLSCRSGFHRLGRARRSDDANRP